MKRGKAQANIITVVLIILLVLASIVVVWNVVKKTVEESSGQVGTEALMVSLDVEEAQAGVGGGLEVKVKRSSGQGNITSLKFILEDVNGQTYTETISEDLPVELETKTYNVFSFLSDAVEVKKISVVPVVGKKFGIEAGKSVDGVALMTGPVSWWKFDGDFNDSAGENHGINYGDAHIEDNVLVLDGDDDYVSVGNPANMQFIYTDNFTLSAWIKTNDLSGFEHIAGKTYGNYRFAKYGAKLSFRLDANNLVLETPNILTIGDWYHVVAVYSDDKTAYVYVNGVLNTSATDNTLDWTHTGTNFRIGVSESYYFNGTMDEVIIFNRSLSADEIKTIYNNQKNNYP